MESTQSMKLISFQIPMPHYERLRELAREWDLTLGEKKRPNLSAAAREVVARGLQADQGGEVEEVK
jgi:hypothetical protein